MLTISGENGLFRSCGVVMGFVPSDGFAAELEWNCGGIMTRICNSWSKTSFAGQAGRFMFCSCRPSHDMCSRDTSPALGKIQAQNMAEGTGAILGTGARDPLFQTSLPAEKEIGLGNEFQRHLDRSNASTGPTSLPGLW